MLVWYMMARWNQPFNKNVGFHYELFSFEVRILILKMMT
jgi:hypothetical protein